MLQQPLSAATASSAPSALPASPFPRATASAIPYLIASAAAFSSSAAAPASLRAVTTAARLAVQHRSGGGDDTPETLPRHLRDTSADTAQVPVMTALEYYMNRFPGSSVVCLLPPVWRTPRAIDRVRGESAALAAARDELATLIEASMAEWAPEGAADGAAEGALPRVAWWARGGGGA